MPKSTLYDRIGGQDTVNKAVDLFYKKNIMDPRIRHYFLEIDLKNLKSHQVLFLSYVFGGIPAFSGRSLWDAHKHLVKNMGLNDTHFDAVAENLQSTLDELGVEKELSDEVMHMVSATREAVLRGDNL
ncbi:MAG: group I truncated hemoglobin [Bdellovibrionales bacterium]